MELAKVNEQQIHRSKLTWSRLCISEEHFRRLFTHMAVHPNFIDVVRLFCEKTGPVEEGFSSLFMNMSEEDLSSNHSAPDQDCSYCTVP
jgi:hypothetical protein